MVALTMRGGIRTPSLAMRLVHAGHLQQGHRKTLSDGQVGERAARPLVDRRHQARALAGQADAGALAEAELARACRSSAPGRSAGPASGCRRWRTSRTRRWWCTASRRGPTRRRTVTPPMSIEPGTCSTSSGLDSPYSITDDAVTILLTEPGSNGEETARLPICLSACRPMSWLRVEGVVVRHRQHLTGFGVQHHRGDVLGAGERPWPAAPAAGRRTGCRRRGSAAPSSR